MKQSGKQMSGKVLRHALAGVALAALTACGTDPSQLDWDLRPQNLSTAEAARSVTANRPAPDSRGVISYPGYQVAVARRGDTVASVAARVGLPAADLARANALTPETALNAGAVLTLPARVAEPSAATGVLAAPAPVAPVATAAITTTTLDAPATPAAKPARPARSTAGPEPVRHKVVRGETAYSISRLYNVTTQALAEWNGLDANYTVRTGQTLLIPVAVEGQTRPTEIVTRPGQGSPTPEPPSATKPLPAENPAPANQPAPGTPTSPDLGAKRTGASAARFAMPAQGNIIRAFAPGKNEGIDIGAAAGSPVLAAADGTVAAITKDTEQVPILVLRHADNTLTVYANIDGIRPAKGDVVQRGQQIAVVRQGNPAFLHFEVRKGFDAVDPMPYLQ
jgi:murein DD-endopeptidase MepM/ murein hydrolase activator NlpD